MGCYVNFASAETRPRTLELKVIVGLQIVKGIILIVLGASSMVSFPMLLGFAMIELFIAGWLWTLRIEAWGVAVGFSIFHILYPLTLVISQIGFGMILVVIEIELVLLLFVRTKGYYSFDILARMEPMESFEPSTIQRTMFNLVFLAQLIKGALILLGAYSIYTYELLHGSQLWFGFSQVQLALLMGGINIIAAIGFRLYRDLGFQLVLITAALSFAETMLAWSFPVVLIGIWIITLMMPCWVKWAFYSGLLARYRKRNSMTDMES
ncbi:MAG: hypothetical protein ACFFDR_00210 [Candidatus Thorarchaeota archaeon]